MLFTHELAGTLLPLSVKVAIGEMIALKALMRSAVEANEDGDGGVR